VANTHQKRGPCSRWHNTIYCQDLLSGHIAIVGGPIRSFVRNTSRLSTTQSIVEYTMFLSLTLCTIGIDSNNAIDSDNAIDSLSKLSSARSFPFEIRTILEVHFLFIILRSTRQYTYFTSTRYSRRRTIIFQTFVDIPALPPTFESFPKPSRAEAVYHHTSH